mgnify:CR=1 FL=1
MRKCGWAGRRNDWLLTRLAWLSAPWAYRGTRGLPYDNCKAVRPTVTVHHADTCTSSLFFPLSVLVVRTLRFESAANSVAT